MDNRLQLAVMRDPRDVVVSSYYFAVHLNHAHVVEQYGSSVDDCARTLLPALTKWISLRYLLFSRILGKRSMVFWYESAMDDPFGWHLDFFSFIGLGMPHHVTQEASLVAAQGGQILGFPSKGLDPHPGGVEAESQSSRSFKDELQPDTLEMLDDVLRLWLHPSMLEELGISL